MGTFKNVFFFNWYIYLIILQVCKISQWKIDRKAYLCSLVLSKDRKRSTFFQIKELGTIASVIFSDGCNVEKF